ncbi:carbamoyltransferase [uncultured Idiomarina sp.]|uniref:carbamoyltransferase family protein n=1 Tax=uncultured Idiomarina sp. TaxID=352961 RepID=UPI00259AB011|nr:carbamoyltransferase [uncultured Idiomarina sp.]
MQTTIIGISAYYHDSAAAIILDGEIVAAAQEERFTRVKHDQSFPAQALTYCLQAANISLGEVDLIVFYDKPLLKFERILESYLSFAPRGFQSFVRAMPVWLKDKLYLKKNIKKTLSRLSGLPEKKLPKLLFTEHHLSHAASAFFPSPYKKAAVLCLDGVGEWATSSVWLGEGNTLLPQWEINYPHSLGLLYSAFTYYAGFKVNSGEYKLMGLAPYGEPKYVNDIHEHLIDLKEDGTFRLNMDYFNFATGLTMTNKKFERLFGGPPRQPESKITQKEMNLARSIQDVTEQIVLALANTIHRELKTDYLCLAGGVALNCVANGRLLREGPFKNIWIQPAAGDAGGSIGAALSAWHQYLEQPREADNRQDKMKGGYLGPEFSNQDITDYLDSVNADYQILHEEHLLTRLAEIIGEGKVVGFFQGRMEFGPRALGNRSIIGNPKDRQMQTQMNLKIKYRESFRPFAPSVMAEKAHLWFDLHKPSPYMLIVAEVHADKQVATTREQQTLFGLEKLNVLRSAIPAVTHVDNSARVQTVSLNSNPLYYRLLEKCDTENACPVLINTSFNVRGEPIVCSPQDAYQCFMRTEMDYLMLENQLLSKESQPKWRESEPWQQKYLLD